MRKLLALQFPKASEDSVDSPLNKLIHDMGVGTKPGSRHHGVSSLPQPQPTLIPPGTHAIIWGSDCSVLTKLCFSDSASTKQSTRTPVVTVLIGADTKR